MADVSFGVLTIPTPQPYDSKDPNKQQENFFYVLNQILTQGKVAGWSLSDPKAATDLGTLDGLTLAVQDLKQPLDDLRMIDTVFDFGFLKITLSGNVEYML